MDLKISVLRGDKLLTSKKIPGQDSEVFQGRVLTLEVPTNRELVVQYRKDGTPLKIVHWTYEGVPPYARG